MSKLPWELQPVNAVHDPALDRSLVDPFAKFAPTRPVNPLLVRDPVTGLWPGQQTPVDIPDFLKRPADAK